MLWHVSLQQNNHDSIKKRLMQGAMLAVLSLVFAASMSWVQAAIHVPLPSDAINTSKPHEVQVGGQVLEVSSYMTEMEEEDLIVFFNKVLPNSGWRVSLLPWHARHEKTTKAFEQAYSIHKDASDAKQMKNRLNQYQEASATLRRQIYAEKESEHIIINLMPMKGHMTIFINRWSAQQARWVPQAKGISRSGSAVQAHGASRNNRGGVQADLSDAIYKDPAKSGANEWLNANVCCTGEGIADQKSAMPYSVPRYPGANAVAKSTSSDKKHITVILESADSLDEVVAYYRRHMPYNGWTLSGENRLLDQGFGLGRSLRYQKPDRYCDVNLQSIEVKQNETNLAEGDLESASVQTVITVRVIYVSDR